MHLHQSRHSSPNSVIEGPAAEHYDRFSRWLMPRVYRAVAADVRSAVTENGAVLDVGTGPGRLLIELSLTRPDLQLIGVDPSEDMVALSRANALKAGMANRISVRAGYVEDLPFSPESFDMVVSTFSAHHWADPARGLAEQARVLRQGGQLRIYDLRSKNLHELAAGPLPAGLALSGSPDHRFGGPVLRTLVATLVAVKHSSQRS
jgi:ubiquinone/menaquinone biosynthesis C-methylase UbiE